MKDTGHTYLFREVNNFYYESNFGPRLDFLNDLGSQFLGGNAYLGFN